MTECSQARFGNSAVKSRAAWYIAGLHFECQGCGGCCSGPGEGYIWVTRTEIEIIADFLKLAVGQLRQKYLRRVGLRTTIIEHPTTRDCIFLNDGSDGNQRGCAIYSVRPNQCRNWPFWPENLANAGAWNRAAQKCPGINRGRLYGFEEIEEIKRRKKWWQDAE
ncbi:MAG: YkgJ family cysteine cluster protein [Planctomycetota bacterium]|jgi:Fe-S-cluster containining protein